MGDENDPGSHARGQGRSPGAGAGGPDDPTITGHAPPRPIPFAGNDDTLPTGAVFGHYTVETVLGAGGMGVVYRARQDRPAREVALKVIRPGFASSQALRRFELEAEVLGRLQHPGIAQVYEAGTSKDGQPFFAMELVRGEPLTRYAESKQLTTRQRLELFARVCDAVQHAHTKGVIHRDLKPGNILVDSSGQPKILDFGVARLTQHDVQAVTIQTDLGQLIGTVPYMSPEQVEGDPANLDTRSDVYALGVILYELLTGRMPYDLSQKLIHEAARIIREDEPTRLSSINRTLRGDIETIALKALEKDKGRRYQAASDLGSDITRFLRDEPIVARPASRRYQFRKFAQRNKALVGGVIAAFVLLAAGLAGTSYGLVRAEEQRAEAVRQQQLAESNAQLARSEATRADEQRRAAERQAAIAQAVSDFVNNDLLAQSSPEQDPDPDLKLRTVVERASARLDGKFESEPAVEAKLRLTIGRVLSALGQPAAATKELRRAEALTAQVSGERSLEMADVAHALAWSSRSGSGIRGSDAVPECLRAFEIRKAALGADHPQTLLAAGDLAFFRAVAQGRTAALFDPLMMSAIAAASGTGQTGAEMERDLRRVMLSVERAAAGGDIAAAQAMIDRTVEPFLHNALLSKRVPIVLASASVEIGKGGFPYSAIEAARAAVKYGKRLLGPEHPHTLRSLNSLGCVLRDQGRLAEAEPCFRDAMERSRRVLGEDHPDTLVYLNNLAVLLKVQGRLAEAESYLRKGLDTSRCVLGEEHLNTLTYLNNLALLLQDQGRLAEAEPNLREAMEKSRRVLGEEHLDTLRFITNMASLLRAQGKNDEAAALLASTEAAARKTFTGSNLEWLGTFLTIFARSSVAMGYDAERFAAAETNLLEAHSIYAKARSEAHRDTRGSVQGLIDLYTAWHAAEPGKGYDAKAAEWQTKLGAIAKPGQ